MKRSTRKLIASLALFAMLGANALPLFAQAADKPADAAAPHPMLADAQTVLQISKDEQLKRFKLREKTSFKRFKITAEDWRNRKKWDLYQIAADEMIQRTSTALAPWTLVESNDRFYARIQVLKTLVQRIEAAL